MRNPQGHETVYLQKAMEVINRLSVIGFQVMHAEVEQDEGPFMAQLEELRLSLMELETLIQQWIARLNSWDN